MFNQQFNTHLSRYHWSIASLHGVSSPHHVCALPFYTRLCNIGTKPFFLVSSQWHVSCEDLPSGPSPQGLKHECIECCYWSPLLTCAVNTLVYQALSSPHRMRHCACSASDNDQLKRKNIICACENKCGHHTFLQTTGMMKPCVSSCFMFQFME